MKRAFLEWCGLLLALTAALCAVLWTLSFFTDAGEFQLAFGRRFNVEVYYGRMYLTLTQGDSQGNARILSDSQWSVPGVRWRRITRASCTDYSLRVSLLLAAIVTGPPGGYLIYRFRRDRNSAADSSEQSNSSPTGS